MTFGFIVYGPIASFVLMALGEWKIAIISFVAQTLALLYLERGRRV